MSEPLGLTSDQLLEIKTHLIRILRDKLKFSIYFFGSRANGGFRKYSDLDLWIESFPEMENKEIADLLETFSESDLPIQIDIVTPEKCLDEYRDEINQSKVLWFTKS